MTAEGDAEHVEHFPLQPIGAVPQAVDGVDGQLRVGRQLDFDPEVGFARERAQEVHDFEGTLAIPEFDRRHIDQVIVVLAGRVLEIAHRVEQTLACDIDDRVAVRGYGFPHCARNHEERNWWTELPNGSEISSIVSGGSRSPFSSSGCSSRRRT